MPLVSIKEEIISRANSEQGEEEMEVDSADEQEGAARSQTSKAKSMGNTFSTLSTLGSLRPGIVEKLSDYKWSMKRVKKSPALQHLTGNCSDFGCRIIFK